MITGLITVPDEVGELLDETVQSLLTADFEIGHYIRERIVPRAVLFFTGEALDDDDFEEEEEGGLWGEGRRDRYNVINSIGREGV